VIAVVYPIVLLGIYAPARDVASPHLMGLFAGAHAVLYAFGEEVGWRGYLQDALRPLRPAIRYTTIGVMWGMWHFLTFAGHGSVGSMVLRLLVFYAILIAASAAIGAAVDRSRSLLVATACHLFYTFSQMHSGRDRWVLLGFLVPVVVILVRKWPVPERRDVSIA
jgi:membrane protease YdiL (CAAX protease family)